MKVIELIGELENCPPNSEIKFNGEFANIKVCAFKNNIVDLYNERENENYSFLNKKGE